MSKNDNDITTMDSYQCRQIAEQIISVLAQYELHIFEGRLVLEEAQQLLNYMRISDFASKAK